MIRSERTCDQLIVGYTDQFESVGELAGILRLKWILNTSESSQFTEYDLIVLATREKNKTL